MSRLSLKGITKAFPAVVANDDISFDVGEGEIHALLGENGAGKSTLVKIIYGVLGPDHGEIRWQGKQVSITSPHAARRLGIGMVFQHFSLFDAMTVLENVALGMEDRPSMRTLAEKIREVSHRYGLPIDPERHVHALSVGERQRIEIVRCLLQNPKLLIMDEPTSVLTPQEVSRLFDTLRKLASEGCSILYISHKLHEIKALCEKATILRGGKVVATCDPAQETAQSMAQLMVGQQLTQPQRPNLRMKRAPIMLVNKLNLKSTVPFGTDLSDIRIDLRYGEVLGIAGVAGNGQSELMAALSGEAMAENADSITVDGIPVGKLGPRDRRKLGICVVPEERNGHAAVADLTMSENALLSSMDRLQLVKRGLIDSLSATGFADQIIKRFGVKVAGPEAHASSLSGGNLQKFVVGREILQNPRVLIAAQPTWGVDAGAAATIHQALLKLAEDGSAVLLISQDLDELMVLADRIMVLNNGRLSKSIDTGSAAIEQIGLLMGGLHDLGDQPSAEVANAHPS